MSENLIIIEFNPEKYVDHTVDIVHIESIARILSGKKVVEPWTINKAKLVQKRLEELIKTKGVNIRYIDNPSIFQVDNTILPGTIILAGAFSSQCMADYKETLVKHGIQSRIDPLLSVELD